MWVILRWLIPNALELAAANAHYWHSDFVMKPRITFHLQLTPAPGQQVFFLALQHRDRPDFLKIAGEAGFGREDRPSGARAMIRPFELVSKQNYLCRRLSS